MHSLKVSVASKANGGNDTSGGKVAPRRLLKKPRAAPLAIGNSSATWARAAPGRASLGMVGKTG